jgi:hypothetical protein
MPNRNFVRRRKNIPDQASPISGQEQARLLNDPAVPINKVRSSTESDHDNQQANGVAGRSTRPTPQQFIESETAA